MPERDLSSAQFEESAIAAALGIPSRAVADIAFGRGQRYDLADGQLSLEIFPTSGLSRITTPTSRLELFGAATPQVTDGQVVFGRDADQEDITLCVSPEGTVVFGYVSTAQAKPEQPATVPETAQEPLATPSASDGPAGADTPPTAPLRTPPPRQHDPEPVAADPAPATSSHTDQPKQEQQPRLQLTGRLGRDPNFRTSPRGTLIGRFPLAVHRDDGTTTWHTILAFGDRAKQLQHRAEAGELTKGQEVTLIGYPHPDPAHPGWTRKDRHRDLRRGRHQTVRAAGRSNVP